MDIQFFRGAEIAPHIDDLAPWSPFLNENYSRASLYVPSDYGMPDSGIGAENETLCPTNSRWLVCELDLHEVRRVREQGPVFTRHDWPRQFEVLR